MTRIFSSETPNSPAMKRRIRCGFWLVRWIVNMPARYSATQARGSIGAPAVRWLTIRRSTITSASFQAASMSPPPIVHSCVWFVPMSSWTSGDDVLERLLRVDDDRQRVVLDDDLLGGVDDAVLVAADHDGDGLADVLDGVARQRPRLGRLDLDARRHPRHRHRAVECQVLGGEHAVDTGRLRAADASIETIRACASVERTTAM